MPRTRPRTTPIAGPFLIALAVAGTMTAPGWAGAQAPEHVLVRTLDRGPDGRLAADEGAAGLAQQLQKLRTTASVLYTAGHPDDEEAGVLTVLSRGMGVRTALLTLNRGEGGANAIGPELFDALGLIRTEELRLAGRYYGLDDQYFTTAIDYGYSKTLDEALRSWDREAVIGDMVRVIRTNRPLVVISRWHGSDRDGHGHHQASGLLTPLAVEAAADPARYPEQITEEGLRPWRVPKLYRGRLLADDTHHAEVDPHAYAPWLGRTYQDFGAHGLSLQRSQTQGRVRRSQPGSPARYERLHPVAPVGLREASIFEGLDTTLPGAPDLLGVDVPEALRVALRSAASHVDAALAVSPTDTTRLVADHVARALLSLREARSLAEDPDLDFLLAVKEEQAAHALQSAAGLRLSAIAVPAGAPAGTPLGPASAGQTVDVHLDIDHAGWAPVEYEGLSTRLEEGWALSMPEVVEQGPVSRALRSVVRLEIPGHAEPSRPWFRRSSPSDNQYTVLDSSAIHLGESPPRASLVARLRVGGAPLEVAVPVRTVERAAPYGTLERPLVVVPDVSVSVAPASVVATGGNGATEVSVTLTSHSPRPIEATVRLEGPGFRADPSERVVTLERNGAAVTTGFRVTPPRGGLADGALPARIGAVVEVDGRTVRDEVQVIAHRDLGTARLFVEAGTWYSGGPWAVADGLAVGYVMGVGDDVPSAIAQLGARVDLLTGDDLSSGDLDAFDVIVVGTRAYAVRPDLVAANARVLEFAARGGHLVVLYQTPEYRPEEQAPFPATLPGNAEEVSEEDAPLTILAPDHPLVRGPNPLGASDFAGWIEQRGSKFFATWSDDYTPLVETHDTGQAEQRGVWLTAETGDGHFTYVALALHRQLPYGVPGAWRILANLLSLGR